MPLLTTEDAKKHLNVTHSFDDALIAAKLVAATDWVASYTSLEIPADPSDSEEDQVEVSARVNEAILLLVAHLYNNRETVLVGVVAQELPFGLLDMLADYRAWCA
jgi:hypothetical protein